MNDLFRAIFGVQPNDQYTERMDDTLSNDHNNLMDYGGDDDDDDNNMSVNGRDGMNVWGFRFFNDPVDIHKHFERLMDDMNRTFGLFGFGSGPSIIMQEDENSNTSISSNFNVQPVQRQENLRDLFLKQPDCACRKTDSNNSDSESGAASVFNSESQFSVPQVYSKSVFIQTVRRPDGSVKTIKKVCDHTGNEETTITESNVNDPLPSSQVDPQIPNDTSGISIFKKFFPF